MGSLKNLLLVAALFFASLSGIQAATTGKISGRVSDAKTGEPLIGVNVIVENTSLGAATDQDGFFFIINVPPGTYDLEVSYIGYQSQKKIGVSVQSDLTSRVDFKLEESVIEGDVVEIFAEKPSIQRDLTASQQGFSNREIDSAPIQQLSELIDIQAGVNTVGSEASGYVSGAPGDGMHIRGGRENETLFLVDGIKVGDDIYGGSRYLQNTSGSSIEEMKTIIGTFNAEYGGKMAGVISAVTKDGDDKLTGTYSAYTDNFGISRYDRNTYQNELTLSGPVPLIKKLYFYANGQLRTTDGRPDIYGLEIPNWQDSKGQIGRYAPGTKVPADWNDQWNGMLKLTYNPISTIKLSLNYFRSYNRDGKYKHAYRYIPYSFPFSETNNYGVIFKLVHTLSKSTFYDFITSYQYTDFFYGVNKTPEFLDYYGSRIANEEWYYSGADNEYNADSSKTFQAVLNLTSQINNNHQLKTGVELRRLDVMHRMSVGGSIYQEVESKLYEKYAAFARRRPLELATYLQDKMEFDEIGLIVNVGVRGEYWDPRMRYMEDPNSPYTTPMIKTDPKIRISPRFGISYPISEKAAFHLAYGHFYQFPRYMELLSGLNDRGFYSGRPNLSDPGPGISNANANPEKTVSYETGVQFQAAPEVTMNVTAYYRELSDLIGVRWMSGGGGYVYLDNVDFGNSRGIEIVMTKKFTHNWSLRLNYTWSKALISTSSPLTAAQKNRFIAYQTFLADWDRPHVLGGLFIYGRPRNWTFSLGADARSGRPYSVLAEVLNTERMPWEINTKLQLTKFLHLMGFEQSVFLRVNNIFDRRNVLNVYQETGKWNDDGLTGTPPDYDAQPTRISDGRTIQVGAQITF